MLTTLFRDVNSKAVMYRHAGGIYIPRLRFLDSLAFLIPLLRFIELEVVGYLYLTELLLMILLLPLLARYGRRLSDRMSLVFVGLLLIWLIAQVATDLIRATPFDDFARGWAKIVFTLINFCALYLLLYGKPKRLLLFAAGAALGDLISFFVSPDVRAAALPWKFGYGTGATWLLVLSAVAVHKGNARLRRFWPTAILLGASFLNIYMGFRSLGGIAFLTSCYLAFQAQRWNKGDPIRVKTRQWVILGTLLVFGAWGVLNLYEYSVRAGWLGEHALQKYEKQEAIGYGLLLGGRSEILVSSRAVLDSPLIGHGSWAKDCRYSTLLVELKQRAGYAGWEQDDCKIPSHSYIMGAWVEAGLIGAVFWIAILSFPIRVLTRLCFTRERLSPIVAFAAFFLIWNIMFSPFAAWARFMMPFYIVLLMSYLTKTRYSGVVNDRLSCTEL